jgi:hypothetical protein
MTQREEMEQTFNVSQPNLEKIKLPKSVLKKNLK